MALTMSLFTRAVVFGATRPAVPSSSLASSRLLSARMQSPRMISVLVP